LQSTAEACGRLENDCESHDRNGQDCPGERRVAFGTEALTGGAGLSVGKRDFHSGREKAGHMRERREGGGVRSNFNGAGGLLRMCRDVIVSTRTTTN